ncbi:MAG: hypothetical protein JSS27_05420 [Planctomycetes bacterium]|nr:hypothetical protein [Planctomycetota bacterium]
MQRCKHLSLVLVALFCSGTLAAEPYRGQPIRSRRSAKPVPTRATAARPAMPPIPAPDDYADEGDQQPAISEPSAGDRFIKSCLDAEATAAQRQPNSRRSRPTYYPTTPVAYEEETPPATPLETSGDVRDEYDPCPDCGPQGIRCGDCDRWVVQADAMWLQATFHSSTLAYTQDGTGAQVDSLRVNSPLSYQPSVRIRIARQINYRTTIEGIFYGAQQWSASGVLTPDPGGANSVFSRSLQTPGILGGLSGPASYNYGANFYNAELNQRVAIHDRLWTVSILSGVRYVQWNDRANLTAVDPVFGGVESVNARAYNYSIGPQLGLGFFRQWSRVRFNADFKGAMLFDWYTLQLSNTNSTGLQPGGIPAIRPINAHTRQSAVSGAVDLFANATYQVTSNIAVRGGYQLLYLPGMAMSQEQFGGFTRHGSPFLHGPAIGLEWQR